MAGAAGARPGMSANGRAALLHAIAAETRRSVGAEATALSDALRARHGGTVVATLFYGSCLRPPTADAIGPGGADERLYDFYLLVDDLRAANGGGLRALGNRLLPPNVYFLQTPFGPGTVRCKYAVLTLGQFAEGCSTRTFHNYFWGRFAQPAAVPFARDEDTRAAIDTALAEAAATLIGRAAPLFDAPFTPAELWTRAFAESYRCELRPESPDRAGQIYRADAARYDAIAADALLAAGLPAIESNGRLMPVFDRRARRHWALRRIAGKSFNVLRLVKASTTVADGIDYILWKIERHSGVKTTLSAWQRRHPLLAAPGLAWKLYRQGAFR
ncbi:MAG: hypothetical protein AB7R90_05865 [Reyranellaceae bacterium]